VLNHESKCRNLHGHRYVAEVTVIVQDDALDALGRIIDFGEIKTLIGTWIDIHWDHNMILHPDDPLMDAVTDVQCDSLDGGVSIWKDSKRPFEMPVTMPNPTAENMVRVLFHVIRNVLFVPLKGIDVSHVRLYETPNCWADYSYPVLSLADDNDRDGEQHTS
jgi:6-pyruvoyltetrahydropterin/6-carboxytetrahydropterin synthase